MDAGRRTGTSTVRPRQRTVQPGLEADQTALLVPLEAVVLGANARSDWDQADERLQLLLESIRESGILEPLLVRELHQPSGQGGRRFGLVAGYRRYAAARSLGLARVPVRVIAVGDDEAVAVNLAENLAREDLAEADALRAVQQLQDTYGWGVRRIARTTGRASSWISELMAVARSGEERAAVESGRLAMNAAARLVRLKDQQPALREAFLTRVRAGERVEVQEVPRLRQLRPQVAEPVRSDPRPGPSLASLDGSPAAEPAGRMEAVQDAVPPAAPAVGRVVPGAGAAPPAAPILELGVPEESMVRNLRLTTRLVLSTLHQALAKQGRDRVLPRAVREELQLTAEALSEFLAQEGIQRSPPVPRR
jgi:ParB/RepB/Spo0J family partition protein